MNKALLKVYKKCKITMFPIDCLSIFHAYGLTCIPYSSLSEKRRIACMELSKDAFISNDTVFYNDTVPEGRVRFTLMHEFAHFILGHEEETEETESEADLFASMMLAPMIIIRELESHSSGRKITADDIKAYFNVSITAANTYITEYHRWYKNIAHTTRKPTNEELAIKELFQIDSVNNKPVLTKSKTRYSKRYEEYARKSILLQQYGYEPAYYSIYDE